MDKIVDLIKELGGFGFLAGLMLFLSTVAPGFLVFYHYKQGFFIELDLIKLLILSGSVGLPFIAFNIIILGPPGDGALKAFRSVVAFSGAVSSLALYLSFFLSYLLSASFQTFIVCALVINFIAVLLFRKAAGRR